MPSREDLVGPIPDGIDPEAYDRLRRRVLWSLPMGLYLLGSGRGEDKNLMTLNWLTQVATHPHKLVAVSVEASAHTHALVAEHECFAVSLLAREDRAIVRKFVKPAVHDADTRTLNDCAYVTATTGAPILASAAAYLDCELAERLDVGSHTIFVGRVVDAGGPAAAPDGGAELLRMEDTRMSYGG
jgi:flavin reductase (DIM6/NTAB) family NADH-FMN oxidoreductase RutF